MIEQRSKNTRILSDSVEVNNFFFWKLDKKFGNLFFITVAPPPIIVSVVDYSYDICEKYQKCQYEISLR